MTFLGQPGTSTSVAAVLSQQRIRADLGAALTAVRQTAGASAGAPSGAPLTASVAEDQVNVEVTTATLDPTGLADHAVLISRLTAFGPAQQVVDPASVTNARYLDRLGRPETTADGVVLDVGGEHPTVLTEARFDKPLPLAVHVEYALDGTVVPAADVPGAAGDLAITYTLTNTTAQSQDLTYEDAAGNTRTSTQPVFAPYQGTLTVTLPPDTVLVDGGGAILAADDQGRTVAQWNLSLFPPISTPIQRATMTMRTERAAIPAAVVLLTPAAVDQTPATRFSNTLLAGSTKGSEGLYDGLTKLDAGALAVADGSARLAGGLDDLATGTDQAASAGTKLAGGVDALAEGATQVADGGADLADALDRASEGAATLANATEQLARAAQASPADRLTPLISGGQQIEAGLDAAAARIGSPADPVLDLITPLPPDGDDTCPAGGTAPPDDDCVTIYQGVRALRDGLAEVNRVVDAILGHADRIRAAGQALADDLGTISSGAETAAQTAQQLYAELCQVDPPTLDEGSCARLKVVADTAGAVAGTTLEDVPIVGEIASALTALDHQASAIGASVDAALAATERLLAGVAALGQAVGRGTPEQPGLAAAMAALNAGLAQLSAALTQSQAQLSSALTQVADGSGALATGIGQAAGGAEQLADGSAQLATGAQNAAGGADQLAAGLGTLATGSGSAASAGQDLAAGAQDLQQHGTAPAAGAVLSSSTDPALAQAWLGAAGTRSADALPYGPPAGWAGQAAYLFRIDQVDAPRSLWDRIKALFGG